MKIRVQIVIEHEEMPASIVEEIGVLTRAEGADDVLGLTLAESKELVSSLQEKMLTHQIEAQLQAFKQCQHCQKPHRRNGHHHITYRTLFGKFKLTGQRYYHCPCQVNEGTKSKTFSPLATLVPERTAPEFAFIQSKWASLMSYGLTVKLLEDVLPLQTNVATVFHKTQETAERLEAELGEENHTYMEGTLQQLADLPDPNDRLSVGIDGGYIRGRDEHTRKAGHFEVIVGKSLGSFRK